MAQAGIASRRASEELIIKGRVRVNGAVAMLGEQADPEVDVIEVDGNRLHFNQPKIYIALYKPKHVITTNVGHRGDSRQTVRDLVPFEGHLFTIGRLDADSEGLVVLTNDGELAQRLSHPRYQHTKTYRVVVHGLPDQSTIQQWERGVFLEDGMTAAASVKIVKGSTVQTTLRIVMIEGKKRQIRRVASFLGHPVDKLLRTHIGMLSLGTLRPGEWRELTPQDLKELSTTSPELKAIKNRAQKNRRHPIPPPVPGERAERFDEGSDRPRRTSSPGRARREAVASTRGRPRAGDPVERPRRSSTRRSAEGDTRASSESGQAAGDERPRRRSSAGESTGRDQRPPRRSSGDTRPPRQRTGARRATEGSSERPARRATRRPHDGEERPRRAASDRPTGSGERPPKRRTTEETERTPRRRSPEGRSTDGDTRPRRTTEEGSERAMPRRRSASAEERPARRDAPQGEDRPKRRTSNRPAEGENRPRRAPRPASGRSKNSGGASGRTSERSSGRSPSSSRPPRKRTAKRDD